jgi:hypothetical protein
MNNPIKTPINEHFQMNQWKERGTLYDHTVDDTHLYEVLEHILKLFHDHSSL